MIEPIPSATPDPAPENPLAALQRLLALHGAPRREYLAGLDAAARRAGRMPSPVERWIDEITFQDRPLDLSSVTGKRTILGGESGSVSLWPPEVNFNTAAPRGPAPIKTAPSRMGGVLHGENSGGIGPDHGPPNPTPVLYDSRLGPPGLAPPQPATDPVQPGQPRPAIPIVEPPAFPSWLGLPLPILLLLALLSLSGDTPQRSVGPRHPVDPPEPDRPPPGDKSPNPPAATPVAPKPVGPIVNIPADKDLQPGQPNQTIAIPDKTAEPAPLSPGQTTRAAPSEQTLPPTPILPPHDDDQTDQLPDAVAIPGKTIGPTVGSAPVSPGQTTMAGADGSKPGADANSETAGQKAFSPVNQTDVPQDRVRVMRDGAAVELPRGQVSEEEIAAVTAPPPAPFKAPRPGEAASFTGRALRDHFTIPDHIGLVHQETAAESIGAWVSAALENDQPITATINGTKRKIVAVDAGNMLLDSNGMAIDPNRLVFGDPKGTVLEIGPASPGPPKKLDVAPLQDRFAKPGVKVDRDVAAKDLADRIDVAVRNKGQVQIFPDEDPVNIKEVKNGMLIDDQDRLWDPAIIVDKGGIFSKAVLIKPPQFGGIFSDLPNLKGYERHHCPSNKMSPYTSDDSPAIVIMKEDHVYTHNWGGFEASKQTRKMEKQHIESGNYDQALAVCVEDIRRRFGTKYDEAVEQMINASAQKRGRQ